MAAITLKKKGEDNIIVEDGSVEHTHFKGLGFEVDGLKPALKAKEEDKVDTKVDADGKTVALKEKTDAKPADDQKATS